MAARRGLALIAAALLALIWPAAGAADHLTPAGTVSAQVTERTAPDVWTVEIRTAMSCQGAPPDNVGYDGHVYLVDLDTGERTYVGGFATASYTHEIRVVAIARAQRLTPEVIATCYEQFPLHGSFSITFSGDSVTIPARFGGSAGGGGGGGGPGPGPGSGGGGDPTQPLRAGGCRLALLGTNGPDRLTGGAAGDVVIGFGAADRMRGEGGHDCLVGGPGADRLTGGDGDDRLAGGRGADTLVGGPGANAYDAGGGNDVVRARNGRAEIVRCGPGRDRAYVDRRDRVRGCELSLVGAGR